MRKRPRVYVRMAPVTPNLLTRQEPLAETDINQIVAKARRGIPPTWLNRREPIYADVSSVPKDLSEAYAKIEAAEEAFLSLPAEVRTAIDNDPRNLEEWLRNPSNLDQAVRYGLVNPPAKQPEKTSPEAAQAPQKQKQPAAKAEPADDA